MLELEVDYIIQILIMGIVLGIALSTMSYIVGKLVGIGFKIMKRG